ncbi:MAG: ribonuclease HIII, partial [Bacilli bacterium]|nr:ribonuclease HIII [Bacilli bacterium]
MNNKSVTLKASEETLSSVKKDYAQYASPFKGEYIIFKALKNGLIITAYENKKGEFFKIIFSGNHALEEALKYDVNATYNIPKKVVVEKWLDEGPQIGSDEVGVGDLLLPMIVVSAYVSKEDVIELKRLGIHDSKKMSDETILKIGPLLCQKFAFSKLTLPNAKMSDEVLKGENLNTLKAKMHNRALLNLKKKFPIVKNIYIDQFVSENTYYKYLKNEKEILSDLVFKTKGESSFPSIALASVIARYAFLLEKEKLEKKYGVKFPYGANKIVDEFSTHLIA